MNTNYKLKICPNSDGKTASFIGVDDVTDENTIFAALGKYEGFNNYETDEVLIVDEDEYDGKKYSITKITPCSVSHCRKVKEIFIGADVNEIDWNMYECVSLLNIRVDSKNKVFRDIDGVLFKDTELIAFPHGRKGKYTVPKGTKKLCNSSFKSCQIDKIVLPDSLEVIGINVFYECRNLSEITLPAGIKKVAKNCDVGKVPIKQIFYLAEDTEHSNPLSISEITKMFPA